MERIPVLLIPLALCCAVGATTAACSSGAASSNLGDGGGPVDATSGSDSSAATEAGDAGAADGAPAGDASDEGPDVSSCPAVSVLPARVQECVAANCCGLWTTCYGDPGCVTVAECFAGCRAEAGAAMYCVQHCVVDAGSTPTSEFIGFGMCANASCNLALDAAAD